MKKSNFLRLAACVAVLTLVGLSVWYFAFELPARRQEAEWMQAVEEYRANKTAQFAAENERYADYEVDVAFIGDSLTDGYDVAAYYPQFLVSNRGIGGDTTFDLAERLQVSVYDLKPKVVVMLIGGNNPHSMFDNYESILQGLQKNLPDTKVVLVSLTVMSGEHWGKNNQLAAYNNVKIKLLADKYGFTFVDLYSPMMDLSTGELYAHYTVDGAHLTAQGYEKFTGILTPVLDELLTIR